MSWGVSSRNVSHEDYDCVLRLPDLVRKCTWHTGVRHSVPSCSAFNGTDGDFRPSSTSVAKCVDCAGVEPGDVSTTLAVGAGLFVLAFALTLGLVPRRLQRRALRVRRDEHAQGWEGRAENVRLTYS